MLYRYILRHIYIYCGFTYMYECAYIVYTHMYWYFICTYTYIHFKPINILYAHYMPYKDILIVVVCIDIWGNELGRHVGVGMVVTSRSRHGVMFAQWPRIPEMRVHSNPALGLIFPIFITTTTIFFATYTHVSIRMHPIYIYRIYIYMCIEPMHIYIYVCVCVCTGFMMN